MKIEEVEGIVLSETNYGASSKILNVLTKEHSLIGIMSKGCRNIKNKLSGVSRCFIYGKFHIYYKENHLSTLISVDVKDSFLNIFSDIEKISYASYLLDLTYQVIKENNDDIILDILISSLEKINENYPPLLITNIVETKYLDFLGVGLNIDSCSICGNTKNIVSLSSQDGGLICSMCHTNHPLTDINIIKLIRLYYYIDIKKITKLELDNKYPKQINTFLSDYYDRYTGLYLKSKKFIHDIEKVKIS